MNVNMILMKALMLDFAGTNKTNSPLQITLKS